MTDSASNGDAPAAEGGTVLVFLNEVAGGRKLLSEIRERSAGGTEFILVAPQNQPAVGQIVNRDEARDAALSRVEVTQAVLASFGIEAAGAVLDPDPLLALDDAVRAFQPREVLLSALPESRFGLLRKDLVAAAQDNVDVPVTHIPVRIEDDAMRWDVTHTLVVATQTVASPDLLSRLKKRASEKPHRYTFVCPRSGEISREEVCERLARTLAELYRDEIDATGQPMSPEPFVAVQNAVTHYRIDDIMISTFAGERSAWLEEGLIGRVKEITDKPIEHVESARSQPAAAAESPEPATATIPAGDVTVTEEEEG